MKYDDRHNPDTPAPPSKLDVLRDAAFAATPRATDAELAFHAYKEAYKTDGTYRNVRPTTAEEKAAAASAEREFRASIFTSSGDQGLQAAAVFCHHARVRSSGGALRVNFLAEIRDSQGRSLIPFAEEGFLYVASKGLVTIQVVREMGRTAAPLLHIPRYSSSAFEADCDGCAEMGGSRPLNYLGRRIVQAATECLNENADKASPFYNIEVMSTQKSLMAKLASRAGDCLVHVEHDPKTLLLSFHARRQGPLNWDSQPLG